MSLAASAPTSGSGSSGGSSGGGGSVGGSGDSVGRMRAEIHEIEKQLQRAIEKRETLKLMISQIELEEHELSIKLKNKKVEFRKAVAAKEATSGGSAAMAHIPDDQQQSQQQSQQQQRGVVLSVADFQHLCDALPALSVAPLVDSVMTEVRRIAGPEGPDGAADAIAKHVAARSLSTYPLTAGGSGKRQGNPICDRYSVEVTNGRFLFALADGCNWGERSLDAARKATRSFVAHLSLNHGKLTLAHDAGSMLLDAFSHAHNEIIAGKKDLWEAGTTTLIGGVLFPLAQGRERRSLSLTASSPHIAMPVAASSSSMVSASAPAGGPAATTPSTADSDSAGSECGHRTRRGSKHSSGRHSPAGKQPATAVEAGSGGGSQLREFGVCLLSIGDCKCFVYDPHTKKARDVTAGNRGNLTDVTDPGGRLGPYADGGLPDTRNLTLLFAKVHQDDLVILCTDGVHDNLDPSSLGIEPEELAPEFKGMTWDQAGEANRQLADSSKAMYAETRLETLIGEQLEQRKREASADPTVPPPPPTPMDIATQIVEYAQRTTFSGRDFMENNPSKKLPRDYKLYPGKMDHTTCLVIRVDYPIDPEDEQHAPAPSPSSVTTALTASCSSASATATATAISPSVAAVTTPSLVAPTETTK